MKSLQFTLFTSTVRINESETEARRTHSMDTGNNNTKLWLQNVMKRENL